MAQRLGTIARNLALKSSNDLVERVGARALPELPPCIWGRDRERRELGGDGMTDGCGRMESERFTTTTPEDSRQRRAGIREIASFVVPPRPKIERTRTHLDPVALDT